MISVRGHVVPESAPVKLFKSTAINIPTFDDCNTSSIIIAWQPLYSSNRKFRVSFLAFMKNTTSKAVSKFVLKPSSTAAFVKTCLSKKHQSHSSEA